MRYYVISPNVWNDGNCDVYADFMFRHNIVCVGYDAKARLGRRFKTKVECGDRIVVARRKDYNWKVFFAGIIDGVAKEDGVESGQYSLARDLRSVIDLRSNQGLLRFTQGMTAFGKKNPGTIFELHPSSNDEDASFVGNLEKMISENSKALSFSIREVANWRINGRVAIPALQRGLVWSPEQLELLWDSLLRGFPIGAFVFSVARNDSSQRTTSTVDGAEYFLLDGQQRANAIFQAFADSKDETIYSRVWVDLLPLKSGDREFSIRVTNKSHPWGFDIGCNVLGVKRIRQAISEFTHCPANQLGNFDLSSLQLDDTWPVDAVCPVPLSLMMKWFDLYGASESGFEERVVAWLSSCGNKSMKYPSADVMENLRNEIKKYHHAIGCLSTYRIFANVLRQELLEADEKRGGETSALESLFTRLNTMGSRISPYDLRYSAIKAYWGNIKERNDEIAAQIMPGAALAVFAIRLALTVAEERYCKQGVPCKVVDIPSVVKIRKLGTGKDLDEKEKFARQILLKDFYAGTLEKLIEKVEKALIAYDGSENKLKGLPPFIRTSIISASPDVYLLLLILAYHGVLNEDVGGVILSIALYIHWMNCDAKKKKDTIDSLFSALQVRGYTVANLKQTMGELVGDKVFALPKIQNGELVGANLALADKWNTPKRSIFYSRLAWNWEMLIFAEREYFNRNFKYDPAQTDFIKGHNKPWDYDHIIPKDWVANRKRGDFRGVCKYWLWTIGNFAAIPFSINRGKSNNEEWDEYLQHADDLMFDRRIKDVSRALVNDCSKATLFCHLTADRLIAMYERWRSFVALSLDLPSNMDIEEDPIEEE